MNKVTIIKTRTIIFTCLLLLFGSNSMAKTKPATVQPVQSGEIFNQTNSKLWQTFASKPNKAKSQEQYIPMNSTYLVYPVPPKNTDITSFKLKNKSVSVSIPIQHKKSENYATENEEKKIIKTSQP